MKRPVLVSLFTPEDQLSQLQMLGPYDRVEVNYHMFPDEETYLQIQGDISKDIKGREVIIFDSLNQPNSKFLQLVFLAETLMECGAKRVGLVCPYLAYMRQDKRFKSGEGVTSTYFAKLISSSFDWLMTVDPHLHRLASLDEIYSIPSCVINAGPSIATWVREHVSKPLLIGPDAESEQWVSNIAKLSNVPYIILEKIRRGDQDVSIKFPDFSPYFDHTPVVIDDIISTASTMIKTVTHLNMQQMKKPICIGVHGIFAKDAYLSLLKSGVANVITCNTISHKTNNINLLPTLSEAILKMLTA